MKKICATLCLLFATGTLIAQEQPTTDSVPVAQTPAGKSEYNILASMSPQDYLSLNMPPLHVLLENARNAPQAQYYEVNRDIEARELKTMRRSWMGNFKVNANYTYGVGDIYNENYNGEGQYPVTITSGNRQSRWNVGASFSMPLTEITTRRNKLKQQQLRIDKTEYDKERWYDNLKIQIIEVYTSAIENFSMLETASGAMAMARAQYRIAETDFINGRINATALSRQKSVESTAVREYEQVRGALNNALLQLEVLTNTRILTREASSYTPESSEASKTK